MISRVRLASILSLCGSAVVGFMCADLGCPDLEARSGRWPDRERWRVFAAHRLAVGLGPFAALSTRANPALREAAWGVADVYPTCRHLHVNAPAP